MSKPQREHWAIRTRRQQMERVHELLVEYGGWNAITSAKNQRWFNYIVAEALDCTLTKAKEYVDILTNASIAKARMKK